MCVFRTFAGNALVVVLVGVGLAAAPMIAAAQPDGSSNQPVTVPYAGGGPPVDQQQLPPAPPPNYAPPRNDRSTYDQPPPPRYDPAPSGYNNSASDQRYDDRYAARDSRDYRSDPAPSGYNSSSNNGYSSGYSSGPDNQRYDDRNYGDPRSDYGPPQDRCRMVEQRTFFPDDSTQRTTVRACRNAQGRWRIAE